jgi:chorismate mutase-like protein
MSWSDRSKSDASLVALAVQRLALGDKVAAAKYGSPNPISDDDREEQLLTDVAAKSREIGLDPDVSSRFFRAQIEANKVIQHRLHDLWSAHPELRPDQKPNLESEVRPQLDAITKQILFRLKALENGTERVADPARGSLDDLHAEALDIALAPIHDRIGTDPRGPWRVVAGGRRTLVFSGLTTVALAASVAAFLGLSRAFHRQRQ